MLQYSFIHHPYVNFIQQISLDYPGIKNAYALFCGYDKRIKLVHYENEVLKTQTIGKKINKFQRFRSESIHLSWINAEIIPFNKTIRSKISQLNIEDENQNSWLLLKYTSPIDHSFDVLLLQIEGVHAFGLSKKKVPVSSKEKTLIGNLLNLIIQSQIRSDVNNYKTLALVNESYDYQLKRIDDLEKENNMIKDNASKSIALFVESLKNKFEQRSSIKLQIDAYIINEIIQSNHNINIIEKVFEKAVMIALNININGNNLIEIKKAYFNWPKSSNKSTSGHQFEKHANILEFLDRYEMAASKSLKNGWKINGTCVGECCEPKVSPASITFNLKKYATNIQKLVEQYDNRWPLLVAHFRPLQNILHDSKSDKKNVLSA